MLRRSQSCTVDKDKLLSLRAWDRFEEAHQNLDQMAAETDQPTDARPIIRNLLIGAAVLLLLLALIVSEREGLLKGVARRVVDESVQAVARLGEWARSRWWAAGPLSLLLVGLETSIVGLPLAKVVELLLPLVYGFIWGPILMLGTYMAGSPVQLLLGRFCFRGWCQLSP